MSNLLRHLPFLIPPMAASSFHFHRFLQKTFSHEKFFAFKPISGSFSRALNVYPSCAQVRMVQHAPSYRANGNNGDDANTEGELNAWKFRAPYKVHENDPNFDARYEASCHCGKVKYQLSREKPLAAKYCHCHTCQKLHGMHWSSLMTRSKTTNQRCIMKSVLTFLGDNQGRRFNGVPSFTKRTSISCTDTTTWAGMNRPRRHASTSFPAKSAAPTVGPRSWTKGET